MQPRLKVDTDLKPSTVSGVYETRMGAIFLYSCTSHRIRIDKSSTSDVFSDLCLLTRSRRSRPIVLRYYGVIIVTRHITMTSKTLNRKFTHSWIRLTIFTGTILVLVHTFAVN